MVKIAYKLNYNKRDIIEQLIDLFKFYVVLDFILTTGNNLIFTVFNNNLTKTKFLFDKNQKTTITTTKYTIFSYKHLLFMRY